MDGDLGFPAVAAHITVRPDAEPWLVRTRTAEMLRRHFAVEHTTLQVEREGEEGRLTRSGGCPTIPAGTARRLSGEPAPG